MRMDNRWKWVDLSTSNVLFLALLLLPLLPQRTPNCSISTWPLLCSSHVSGIMIVTLLLLPPPPPPPPPPPSLPRGWFYSQPAEERRSAGAVLLRPPEQSKPSATQPIETIRLIAHSNIKSSVAMAKLIANWLSPFCDCYCSVQQRLSC